MSDVVAISNVSRLRKANKSDVAEFFDISLPTVESWVRRGCPVVVRGSKTQPWVFDLLQVAEWRISGSRPDGDINPETLPPGERKSWYDSEKKRLEVAESMKELIPAVEIEHAIPTAFAALAQDIRAIPDNLERRYGISPEVAELVERGLFEAMDALEARISMLGPVELQS